jgi:hypothetical protein
MIKKDMKWKRSWPQGVMGTGRSSNTWSSGSGIHPPTKNVNAPELVMEFHQWHASTARQVLQKPAEQGELEKMPAHTPPTSFLPFIFPRQGHTFSPATLNKQNRFNSIHEALDDMSPHCQLWYDNSSLYTSQANRRKAAEDDRTSHAQTHRSQATCTIPRDILPHPNTTTQAEWAQCQGSMGLWAYNW